VLRVAQPLLPVPDPPPVVVEPDAPVVDPEPFVPVPVPVLAHAVGAVLAVLEPPLVLFEFEPPVVVSEAESEPESLDSEFEPPVVLFEFEPPVVLFEFEPPVVLFEFEPPADVDGVGHGVQPVPVCEPERPLAPVIPVLLAPLVLVEPLPVPDAPVTPVPMPVPEPPVAVVPGGHDVSATGPRTSPPLEPVVVLEPLESLLHAASMSIATAATTKEMRNFTIVSSWLWLTASRPGGRDRSSASARNSARALGMSRGATSEDRRRRRSSVVVRCPTATTHRFRRGNALRTRRDVSVS
jgi:hypothetical protein